MCVRQRHALSDTQLTGIDQSEKKWVSVKGLDVLYWTYICCFGLIVQHRGGEKCILVS